MQNTDRSYQKYCFGIQDLRTGEIKWSTDFNGNVLSLCNKQAHKEMQRARLFRECMPSEKDKTRPVVSFINKVLNS